MCIRDSTVNDSSAVSDETVKARVASDFQMGSEPDVLFWFNGADANSFIEAGKVISIDDIRKEYPEYASNMNDDLIAASLVEMCIRDRDYSGFSRAERLGEFK